MNRDYRFPKMKVKSHAQRGASDLMYEDEDQVHFVDFNSASNYAEALRKNTLTVNSSLSQTIDNSSIQTSSALN
jgi:hypothetical protein